MPDPTIRGPKIPLAWSTEKSTGYVVEKTDEDEKCDQVLIDDEDSVYCTEITGLRKMAEQTIEVMPLSGVAAPPSPGDVFIWGDKAMSILTIKKSRSKGNAMKWTITGNSCPGISLS